MDGGVGRAGLPGTNETSVLRLQVLRAARHSPADRPPSSAPRHSARQACLTPEEHPRASLDPHSRARSKRLCPSVCPCAEKATVRGGSSLVGASTVRRALLGTSLWGAQPPPAAQAPGGPGEGERPVLASPKKGGMPGFAPGGLHTSSGPGVAFTMGSGRPGPNTCRRVLAAWRPCPRWLPGPLVVSPEHSCAASRREPKALCPDLALPPALRDGQGSHFCTCSVHTDSFHLALLGGGEYQRGKCPGRAVAA